MSTEIEFAVKVTDTIFVYPLIGFEKNIVYSSVQRKIFMTDANTGLPVKTIAENENLDFDTFVLVARNLMMDIIDLSN